MSEPWPREHPQQDSNLQPTYFETVDPLSVPEGALLFDIREQDEWDAGHAPSARHLPASSLAAHLDELFVEDDEGRERDIYLVCRSGGRSSQVAQWLAMQGIEAINVGGGMDAWLMQGLPVVTDEGEPGRVL